LAVWDVGDSRPGVSKRRGPTARPHCEAFRPSKLLKEPLAPHFIFNALGTLQAQIEKDPAAATADALARLFRQALAAAGRPTVPLRDELDFVEAYLGIERSRLGHRLRVKIDVPEELEEVEIPPLSLQVLVENAVQHGIAPREDGGEILVRARRSAPGENPGIVLSVENPLAPSSRPGTGNGLGTLRGRLANPGDLTVSSAGGLFHAEFWWGTA
jgi:two-component system LytT family sensor kinase